MALAFCLFNVFFITVLWNYCAECDRACAACRRRLVGVTCCVTFPVIDTSETNASGLNHVREKVSLINSVLGH